MRTKIICTFVCIIILGAIVIPSISGNKNKISNNTINQEITEPKSLITSLFRDFQAEFFGEVIYDRHEYYVGLRGIWASFKAKNDNGGPVGRIIVSRPFLGDREFTAYEKMTIFLFWVEYDTDINYPYDPDGGYVNGNALLLFTFGN